MTASLYPLFLNLRNRRCVVVGGSQIAEPKVRGLLDAGARICLIAPVVTSQIAAWAKNEALQWEPRAYECSDLQGAFLVVSIADAETNARVFADAERQHIFCNAVDDIPHCNCYAAAAVRRGPLQIAISTAGNSPALAQRLREEFEDQFTEEYGPWVEQLGETRSLLFQDKATTAETRRKILHDQASNAAFGAFRASRRKKANGQRSVNIPEGLGKTP